ncbi:transposase [Xanthomonas perforans]|uniref:transposase n=2 Tax=Xanthomonas perforans TaxID=442694 RepID=UPI001F282094|nr:transposase [Xanthomonas perforans]
MVASRRHSSPPTTVHNKPTTQYPSTPGFISNHWYGRWGQVNDGDRLRYLHLIHEALHATGCQLHAYVLMDNHVHLLVTPPAAGRIGQLMQRLARNYVALFNGRHRRTGTLWEGRYKACLVDSADYVLRCYRYIELNPVRARPTDNPAAYRWSSCPANLGQRKHSALTPHPCWLALGSNPIQ